MRDEACIRIENTMSIGGFEGNDFVLYLCVYCLDLRCLYSAEQKLRNLNVSIFTQSNSIKSRTYEFTRKKNLGRDPSKNECGPHISARKNY